MPVGVIRSVVWMVCVCCLGCAAAPGGDPKPAAGGVPAPASGGYARPELLAEPAALAEVLGGARLVVLDVRPAKDYAAGHVPGAVNRPHADFEGLAKPAGGFDDPAPWSRLIGSLGIDADSTVVVYDAADQKDAARVWWLLRYWGVGDVRLLDGGWPAWTAAKLPVSAEPVAPAAKPFEAVATPAARLTADEVAKRSAAGRLTVLDVRSPNEFCGADVRSKAGGHIPGAVNLDWVNVLDAGNGKRFKPGPELRKLLTSAGVYRGGPLAVHCQSGGRASVMVFALELMGRPDAANYYRGWSEWGNDPARPVEK